MHRVIGAIDRETRCKHYHGEKDIIAIRFKCCATFYSCYYCHEEAADHKHEVWSGDELQMKEILCGKCHAELTIEDYLNCGYICPSCRSSFNSKCSSHYHFYFEVKEEQRG